MVLLPKPWFKKRREFPVLHVTAAEALGKPESTTDGGRDEGVVREPGCYLREQKAERAVRPNLQTTTASSPTPPPLVAKSDVS